MQSTDEEIAAVIERLSWSLDDLVIILFGTVGMPTLFMDRALRFYESRAVVKPLQLNDPITAKMIRGWLDQPHERVRCIVVQSFLSYDGVLFTPDAE